MAVLGFSSASEAYVYVTCVFLGISVLMPINALTSAPAYMVNYYKYVTGDRDAEPNSPIFWANILTFYNVISVPTQIIIGPTVLTPAARKLSLNIRFILSLSLMMVEVFVILIMPAGGVSQAGAITAFVIVTVAAGSGKSYLEATCYALVGSMKPKFMSAVMFGCGFSGVIASVLQCIIKASMADDYDTVLKQAYIYFSLSLGFMATSLVMAVCLRFNAYAQTHIGEYRMIKKQQDEKVHQLMENDTDANEPHHVSDNSSNGHNSSEVCGHIVMDDGNTLSAEPTAQSDNSSRHGDSQVSREVSQEHITKKPIERNEQLKRQKQVAGEDKEDENDEQSGDIVRAVDMSNVEGSSTSSLGDEEDNVAQQNMTTAEQLQHTRAWPIIKQIYPMQIACFCVFFVSLFIFPSLVIPIDRTSKWFATIAILLYNCGDATGRLSTSFRFLWPSRKVLLIVSFCRFAFIPLIFLCIYGYIPSHAAPYVFMACIGLTNGFFGASSMVFGPLTPGLKTDGQRVMAGQLMGISLLAGACLAGLLAMLVVLFLPS